MARRIHLADPVVTDDYAPAPASELGVILGNVLTAVYMAVVAIIGLDALLEGLDANESTGFVRLMDALSAPLLAPFEGMFDGQRSLLTACIAVVVYGVVYLIAMAVLRRGRRTVY
jgi:hypothetical protein